MLEIKLVLHNIELQEEMLGIHKRLDYYEIAMTLLYAGTVEQKRSINHIMKNSASDSRTEALKEYIDIEMLIGNIYVEG